MNVYIDREQTQAKHFILRRYLQALAFKVLRGWDITYVDGFSGPWKSQTEDYSDTSFMIAIDVLRDAQKRILDETGRRRRIRCFFSEKIPDTFKQLNKAVAPYHKPTEGFEIQTYSGEFEDAVTEIQGFVGQSFPLIFIDPTGWTGYPFETIKPIFSSQKCEVLINFMYDHVNRFVASQDQATVESLNPILGGPGWRDRLDETLPRGAAVEKLFRETLKAEGQFKYVVSTKIDKSTADRPHFFLAYGTKNRIGLKAFRQTEFEALREHAKNRAAAKERKREERTATPDMFGVNDDVQEASIDDIVTEQKAAAADRLLEILLLNGEQEFSTIVDHLLEAFILRETNVKDICVQLAGEGKINNTWGGGNRKPRDENLISLT
jgi:three-Cys-motif partner protein